MLLVETVLLGCFGGVVGSAIDSLLGATLQRTWYSEKTKKVLLGRLPATTTKQQKSSDDDWHIVNGHDILSNNTVNFISVSFVSSALTAVLIAFLGTSSL